MPSVLCPWVHDLTFMQQSVLISAIRGCDGIPKLHKAKRLIKFYRRTVLLSAFDGRMLTDPFEPGGGSFTGPILPVPDQFRSDKWEDGGRYYTWRCQELQNACDDYVDSRDELPAHYQVHMMHAFEILGYKHPETEWREFWYDLYERLVHAYHLWPETEEQMDRRLGDNEAKWRERNDISTSCAD